MSLVYLFQRICITAKLDMIHSYLLYRIWPDSWQNLKKKSGYKKYKGNVFCKTVANHLWVSVHSKTIDHVISLATHSYLTLQGLWLVQFWPRIFEELGCMSLLFYHIQFRKISNQYMSVIEVIDRWMLLQLGNRWNIMFRGFPFCMFT